MDADVLVDDELEPGEADALVGQPAELEGELGVADVHHDLGRRDRHPVERDVDGLDLEQAGVDVPRVSPSVQETVTVSPSASHARRVAAADDRGMPSSRAMIAAWTGCGRRGW